VIATHDLLPLSMAPKAMKKAMKKPAAKPNTPGVYDNFKTRKSRKAMEAMSASKAMKAMQASASDKPMKVMKGSGKDQWEPRVVTYAEPYVRYEVGKWRTWTMTKVWTGTLKQ
jgi:hypothetical protein